MPDSDASLAFHLCSKESGFGFNEGPVDRSIGGRGPGPESDEENTEGIRRSDETACFVSEERRSSSFTLKECRGQTRPRHVALQEWLALPRGIGGRERASLGFDEGIGRFIRKGRFGLSAR